MPQRGLPTWVPHHCDPRGRHVTKFPAATVTYERGPEQRPHLGEAGDVRGVTGPRPALVARVDREPLRGK